MSDKPTIYISKRCEYCIQLLKLLSKRSDIRGNFTIISIDDNPFPNYVKAVPCMVSGNELYSAAEIFGMLQESDDGSSEQPSGGSCSLGGGGGGEPQCDINGYCKGDTCLGFSALEGENSGNLESYYSTIDSEKGEPKTVSSSDDYREKKKNSFDSDYERMMQERGEMGGNGPPGSGGPPPNISFAR